MKFSPLLSSILPVLLKSFIFIHCLPTWAFDMTIASPEKRAQEIYHLAKAARWKDHTIVTSLFTLKAYSSKINNKANTLTIYLEGDGLAWLSGDLPSLNPTPINPVGLKMALHDQKNHPVAYLARPCQLVFNQEWHGCSSAYWTNLRFAPEVIQSTNQAVDYLKKYHHAKQIILIGYSGGGAIAALLAAKRTDVIKLITVAAMLDLNKWVRQKSLTPLFGSLNPADAWEKIASIPQIHWVGAKDTVVPKEVLFAFAEHFPTTQKPQIIVLPTFDHVCCWATDWPPLMY